VKSEVEHCVATSNEVVFAERLWICGSQLWNTGGCRISSAAGRKTAFAPRLFFGFWLFREDLYHETNPPNHNNL